MLLTSVFACLSLHVAFPSCVVELTKELTIGKPAEASNNYMGPVIDQAAYDKITGYIETGKNERELLVGREGDDSTDWLDRKSTRLNSSHVAISYAVFCLKQT